MKIRAESLYTHFSTFDIFEYFRSTGDEVRCSQLILGCMYQLLSHNHHQSHWSRHASQPTTQTATPSCGLSPAYSVINVWVVSKTTWVMFHKPPQWLMLIIPFVFIKTKPFFLPDWFKSNRDSDSIIKLKLFRVMLPGSTVCK